jgi:UDP-galactopyranose mutase
LVFTEFSKETENGDIPYYPKRLESDLSKLDRYLAKANSEEKISFLGRLATYRYLDMHVVIGEALDFSSAFVNWLKEPTSIRPKIPGS